MDKIKKKVISLIIQQARVQQSFDEVTDSTRLFEELGYDSLQIVKLIIDIETELDIEFDYDNLTYEYFSTVGRLCEISLDFYMKKDHFLSNNN